MFLNTDSLHIKLWGDSVFNINAFKRRISFSSYKYVICMLLVLSGVYIAVFDYKTGFQILKQDNLCLLNSLIKNLIALLIVRYASFGKAKYITAPIFLVYSGVGLGTFLMYVYMPFHYISFYLQYFLVLLKHLEWYVFAVSALRLRKAMGIWIFILVLLLVFQVMCSCFWWCNIFHLQLFYFKIKWDEVR